MRCKLTEKQLLKLVNHQLNSVWGGYGCTLLEEDINVVRNALKRSEKCFSKIVSPYFHEGGEIVFKIEHTVQYTVFLYLLSHEYYKLGKAIEASFIYYLNKVMNGVDWFYAIDLPECFFAEHPVGSVLGRASYGDYLFLYQGVTVGVNRKNGIIYHPTLGDYVTLFPDSKIIGDVQIGNHVVIAANAYVKDLVVPDCSIVFGQFPHMVIKTVSRETIEEMTGYMWQ